MEKKEKEREEGLKVKGEKKRGENNSYTKRLVDK
jgi:hypothetical protein